MLQTNGVTNQDVVFIFQNSQFVERHFRYFIEKIDGRAYSADRSRTIIKALVATFSTGEDISFNYEQEYTYHLPEKVFRTHQDIIEFYQGVKNLFYGNPDKYLLAVKKIYQGLQEKK